MSTPCRSQRTGPRWTRRCGVALNQRNAANEQGANVSDVQVKSEDELIVVFWTEEIKR